VIGEAPGEGQGPMEPTTCPKCGAKCYVGTVKKHGHCTTCEKRREFDAALRDRLMLTIVRADVEHSGIVQAIYAEGYASRVWAIANALVAQRPK
jgi:uncharacterized protein (DUF983 family)